MATEFRLPELGENIASGDLVRVMVSKGDTVSQDQPVLELETDKATLEVPSPVSGTVEQVFVKDGDKVKVGQLIFTVDGSSEAAGSKKAAPAPAASEESLQPEAPEETRGDMPGETAALTTEEQEAPPASEERTGQATTQPAEVIELSARAPETPVQAPAASGPAPAAPSVRRAAREIGVNINRVAGSGPGGRINDSDIKRYAREVISGQYAGAVAAPAPLPDFNKWGEVQHRPMTQVRRKTAEHMAQAWSTIPQVTQFDQADITHLEEIRKQYSGRVEKAGGKLTVTAIILKVAASALRVFPQFAASIDMARNEIVYKKYCHIGVAADTDRGLLVPVVRDVDKKNISQLAAELSVLAEKARNRKLSLEDMEGGVFTITNLGGIGGTGFSPIVNYPEVAILGISRSRFEPVYVSGQFEPRLMLPLSLSYDHRLIDGADAARFLRWVAEALEQPFLMPLQG
jgi:pyruvate dehydrogenase E2 component (dihydrolipoyllysine-residue acetyltransferase)